MLWIMSITITLVAAVEWLIIRRLRFRLLRIVVQVPLLVLTFFGAWLLALILTADSTSTADPQLQILDRTTVIRDDLLVTVSATGAVTPKRQIVLAFAISGAAVTDIYALPGDYVTAGQVLAAATSVDANRAVDEARIARDLQQIRLDALTADPREVDLAAAEAQLEAARAQLVSAFSTGTSAEDREISRLQNEIARNQLWQAQLGRDAIQPPSSTAVDLSGLSSLPAGLPDPPAADVQAGVDSVVDGLESVLSGLNEQQRQQYQAQLNQTQAVVTQAEYGVQIAEARYEGVLVQGADPGAVASANAALVQAQIALDRLRNGPNTMELEQAALELELAELAYELAQVNQSQTQLLAPFDGVIARNNLKIGEIPPQGPAILLVDDSEYYVDLPIDESEITRVEIGQRVDFDVDALPDAEITGEVVSIAYAPLNIGQLVAYNVRVHLIPGDQPVRSGMTVTGNIVVVEREGAVMLRNNFVRRNRQTGDTLVWVALPDGTVQERLIVLGDRNDTFSEVVAGLQEGEEVVLLPATESLFGE